MNVIGENGAASDASYAALECAVRSHQLQIVQVIGLPRANGTALHIALTQSSEATAQLNEPFIHGNDLRPRKWEYVRVPTDTSRSFEDVCRHINTLFRAVYDPPKLPKLPITLVLHDISFYITDEEYKKFSSLCSHTVFAIRDPTQQALSLLTRDVNDALFGSGSDVLKPADVLKHMATVDSFKTFVSTCGLPKGKITQNEADSKSSDSIYRDFRDKILREFIEELEVCWVNTEHYAKQMYFMGRSFSIFDAGWLFCEKLESHLQSLCKDIRVLTYTSDMMNKWVKGVGKDFHAVESWGEKANSNAWTGKVRNSTGIGRQTGSIDKSLPSDLFPSELRAVISRCTILYNVLLQLHQLKS